MQRATSSFIYLGPDGGDVFVPKDKVVDDDHPDVKGHEVYFERLIAEAAPESTKRRVRR